MESGKQPPDGLDVLVAAGDVWVLVVQPKRNELLDPVDLDLLLAVEIELLLDLDLDRESVGIPSGDPGHLLSAHRVEPADQVFDGPREDVMDAGAAVRRRRSFVEHERIGTRGAALGLMEQVLGGPLLQDLLFQSSRRHVGPP
jgi:hypothetical protein